MKTKHYSPKRVADMAITVDRIPISIWLLKTTITRSNLKFSLHSFLPTVLTLTLRRGRNEEVMKYIYICIK